LSRLSWGLYAPSMLTGTQESKDPLNPSGSVIAQGSRNSKAECGMTAYVNY